MRKTQSFHNLKHVFQQLDWHCRSLYDKGLTFNSIWPFAFVDRPHFHKSFDEIVFIVSSIFMYHQDLLPVLWNSVCPFFFSLYLWHLFALLQFSDWISVKGTGSQAGRFFIVSQMLLVKWTETSEERAHQLLQPCTQTNGCFWVIGPCPKLSWNQRFAWLWVTKACKKMSSKSDSEVKNYSFSYAVQLSKFNLLYRKSASWE